MALDVASNILLNVKADTKGARRELKKLSGEEKKLAKDFIETQERRNAKIEKQIATIGKLAIGVGAAVGAYKALTASAEFYAKRQQLVAASAGANIARIQDAARGLLTETQALQFAAAAQNTEFKLTQQQMDTVAKAMVSLRNQGNDWLDVQKRLTQAVVEGNSRALRPFGVIIEGSSGKLETHRKVMEALRIEAGKLSDQVDMAGDAFLRSQVKIDDWKGSIVEAMGAATDATLGFVADASEGFAALLGVSGDQIDLAGLERQVRLAQLRAGTAERNITQRGFREAGARALVQAPETQALAGAIARGLGPTLDRLGGSLGDVGEGFRFLAEEAKQAARGGRPIKASVLTVEQQMRVDTLLAVKASLPGIGGVGPGAIEQAGAGLDAPGDFLGRLTETMPEFTDQAAILSEQMITLGDAAQIGFSTFEGAATNAFTAFIDGSASASQIARAFVGDLLSGLATQMWSKSLFHAAEALGFLIPGPLFNPAAAGQAGATAAAYAAGAGLVGLAARSYGGSAPNTGGGRAAASGGTALAAAGGGQPSGDSSQTFIVVQDQFDDDPRAARRRLKKAFDRAQGEYRGDPAVVRA